ncbi:MAG: TonB-dependent receptor [Rhodothermaceae bacterium]|nr:TonB-dependent receptor [Rhodothermaceae bacterium]
MLIVSPVYADDALHLGDTGKIAGRVVDAVTGEALIGVNVILSSDGSDTITGTVTDSDGYYSMIKIKPGTYQVIFSYIGYQTQRTENVKVIVDRTTTIDVQLAEAVIEGEEVIVTAERPLIEFDRTTTTSVVDSEQLEALPVVGIEEVINLQAGVVDGHFRGGRIGEVSYMVNGVPINNAFSNTAAFTVEQNMIESLEVISGVFNAEYGQALSGVVNIVTKDVPSKWTGSLLGYTGSIVSNRELEFVERIQPGGAGLSSDAFASTFVPYTEAASLIGRQDAQLNLGGPLIKDKLGIRLTGRFFYNEGDAIGRRLFSPADSSQNLNSGRDPSTWILQSTGDQSFVPSRNWRYSFNTSLVYKIFPKLQLDYNLFFQQSRGRGFNQGRKYVPDGNNWNYGLSATHIAGLRWTITNNSFATLSYSYLHDRSESRLYDVPDNFDETGVLDQRYVSPQLGSLAGTNGFPTGGNDLFSNNLLTTTQSVVLDFTSQINRAHQVKAGVSARLHDIDNGSYGIEVSSRTGFEPVPSPDRFGRDTLQTKPVEFAAYVQDKMEFGNLIVNAGVRLDYFDPKFLIPIDWTQAGEELIPDLDNPGALLSNRTDADIRWQVSPRLGIAFPISTNGVIRFSAGLFFQIPPFQRLYLNPEYEVNPASTSNSFGNAGINPERTLTFEIGLQQGITEALGVEVTMFSKDVRNLVGQQVNRDVETTNFSVRLINRDVGTIRGATLSVFQRPIGILSWDLDYTLQFAEGTSSDPNEAFLRFSAGLEEVLGLVRLNWDRRHVLTNSISVVPQEGLSIALINRFQTGTPYTTVRNFIRSYIDNNGIKPTSFTTDVRMFYKPQFLKFSPEIFIQVDNLFDTSAHVNVFTDTGRGDESVSLEQFRRSGTQVGGVNSLDEFFYNYFNFTAPRRITLGLQFDF